MRILGMQRNNRIKLGLVSLTIVVMILLQIQCSIFSDPEDTVRNYLLAETLDERYEYTLQEIDRSTFNLYYRKGFNKDNSVEGTDIVAQNADSAIVIARWTIQGRSQTSIYVCIKRSGSWKIDWKKQVYEPFIAYKNKRYSGMINYYAIVELSSYYNYCFMRLENDLFVLDDSQNNIVIYALRSKHSQLNSLILQGPQIVKLRIYRPDRSWCYDWDNNQFYLDSWSLAQNSLIQSD